MNISESILFYSFFIINDLKKCKKFMKLANQRKTINENNLFFRWKIRISKISLVNLTLIISECRVQKDY